MQDMKKILCVMGPTGSGKTAAAIKLAQLGYPIHVINTDSRQVYRDFPIISAQPNTEEKSTCPHFLYGYLPSQERISAGEWSKLALAQIEHAHNTGHIPVLVGGTGLYFRALLDGMVDIPDIPQEIHEKYISLLEQKGSEFLHNQLKNIDPLYAQKVHANDKQRVARALEVFEFTNKTFTAWHHEHAKNPSNQFCDTNIFRLGIGIALKELTPLLAKRTHIMLEKGALLEAEQALSICPDINAPAWTGIGCREIALYLNGEYNKEKCLELWIKNTRAYAKRQWTWFNADKRIQWFRPDENYLTKLEQFLQD